MYQENDTILFHSIFSSHNKMGQIVMYGLFSKYKRSEYLKNTYDKKSYTVYEIPIHRITLPDKLACFFGKTCG